MVHFRSRTRRAATSSVLTVAALAAICSYRTGLSFANTHGSTSRAEQAAAQRAAQQQTSLEDASALDRRAAMLLGTSSLWSVMASSSVEAASGKTVVVAGATGQTGRRILEKLVKSGDVSVIGAVRNVDKAKQDLTKSSITVRGAMVDTVNAVDASGVVLKKIDVAKDSVDAIAKNLQGSDVLIIATGFVPGNPFEMSKEAHAVDNLGTIALVDAAKKAGVKKVVMVSSILTNGRAWGQEQSPGFVITNAFGQVLDEKIVAEKYLRASGLDWTIVRPGGLKSTPPAGALLMSKEDTLNTGEVSRDLVADVAIAAMFNKDASNKVVEIVEGEEGKTVPSASEQFKTV